MPQNQTQTSQTDSSYTAIDPKRDPIAFVFQNKEALGRMDPDKAVKFVDMLFRRYALPKYQQVNRQRPLDEEELERIRLQFAARMFDIPYDQETKLKSPEIKYGAGAKAAATVSSAGAGVIGGLRTVEELREKIQKSLGPIGKLASHDPVNILAKKTLGPSGPAGRVEGRAFEEAKLVSPIGAEVGAAVGHQIPASIAASGAGAILPRLATGAPTGLRVLEGAARGGSEAAAFESARPGGDPSAGAGWGMALGAAFPFLGKLFGLGKRAVSAAPEIAKTAEATAAKAPKSLGDIADTAAKSKFGKSFKDLTSSEKAQMPSVMKEEIAKQQAQKAATKKAEAAAAKASKEAEETAKRVEKAKIATEKAAKQAARRSVVPATTPVAKQAIATQAASENPSIAKIVQPVEKRVTEGVSPTGVERRKSVAQILKENAGPSEGEKLEREMRIARAGASSKITEGEALQHIMKDSQKYGVYKAAEQKVKNKMLIDAKAELEKITKIPEGQAGKKIRAKGGQSASPAQQKADAERIAAKRAEAKQQEFGAALEKHAQEIAGRHTVGSVGLMHIPELEETMKEFPNGELFLKGFQKLRKAGRITDEIYVEEMKNWLLEQFEKELPKASD